MKVSQILAPVAAGFLMSACSVSALVEEVAEELQAQALQEVIDKAKANGGNAVVFKTADGADLAIASGPIAGGRVVIPPYALPEGVEEAVLAISHDGSYSIPGTEFVAAGNTLLVTLQAVPSLEEVGELVTAATVYAPYGEAVSTSEDEAAVELAHDVSGTLEIITDEVDSENALVVGSTRTFSPFLAVLPAPSELTAPEGVTDIVGGGEGGEEDQINYNYSYMVSSPVGILCDGRLDESAVAATFESTIRAATNSESRVDIWLDDPAGALVHISGGWFPGPVLLNGPASMTEPGVTWNVEVSNCGGNNYTFNAVGFCCTMSNWVETSAQLAPDCGQTGDQACTRHVGTADALIGTSGAPDVSSSALLSLHFNGQIGGSVEEGN